MEGLTVQSVLGCAGILINGDLNAQRKSGGLIVVYLEEFTHIIKYFPIREFLSISLRYGLTDTAGVLENKVLGMFHG